MLSLIFLHPVAQITFHTAPKPSVQSEVSGTAPVVLAPWMVDALMIAGAILLLLIVFALRGLLRAAVRPEDPGPARRRPVRRIVPGTPRRPAASAAQGRSILIDGSNVMYWDGNTPSLAPLSRVVADLKHRGFTPGIVFDATAGHRLFGRYMDDRHFARVLDLPEPQVLVVPKGRQADPYLLATARSLKARIVTNDRFRDWADRHPEVREPGFLIRGGVEDGKLKLDGLEARA
jgi:hypothetical protein